MSAHIETDHAFDVLMHSAAKAWHRGAEYERQEIISWLMQLPVDVDNRVAWSREFLVESILARSHRGELQ